MLHSSIGIVIEYWYR